MSWKQRDILYLSPWWKIKNLHFWVLKKCIQKIINYVEYFFKKIGRENTPVRLTMSESTTNLHESFESWVHVTDLSQIRFRLNNNNNNPEEEKEKRFSWCFLQKRWHVACFKASHVSRGCNWSNVHLFELCDKFLYKNSVKGGWIPMILHLADRWDFVKSRTWG